MVAEGKWATAPVPLTQSELANIVRFFDGYLAGVGVVLELRILFVDKSGAVDIGLAATGELERAASCKAIGTSADHLAFPLKTFVLHSTRSGQPVGKGWCVHSPRTDTCLSLRFRRHRQCFGIEWRKR